MNELLILSELMEGPQSGYKLRIILQWSLGHNRKISYGVLYPLLNKLETAGYIESRQDEEKQNKKISYITEKGKVRFFDLMREEVAKGAHTADIYLIKLDAMQHLPIQEQYDLLDKYEHEQKIIITDTEKNIEFFRKKKCQGHWYAEKKMELCRNLAKETINWINKFRNDLKEGYFNE